MKINRLFCLFSIVSVIVSAIVIYGNTLNNDFLMKWDDGWMVFNDYTENFSWNNTFSILTEFYKGQYSPLNQFVYCVIYQLVGYNAFGFHLTSLLLHIGCALLVLFILRNLVNPKVAWCVAMLFTVHPMQVETVAWISASKILWYAFFYLWAVYLYIRYVRGNNPWCYLGVFACFIFSFGGKEQAVTLPVCLLLLDWVLKRNFRNSLVWKEKIPFFALALFFSYVTLLSHASRGNGLLVGQMGYPFYQRVALGAYAFTEYITKLLVPVNLLYLYPFPMQVGESLPYRFWLYPIGWVAIIGGGYKYWSKRPLVSGMLFYIVLIALTIQIIPMARAAIVADRYVYLAALGLFFIVIYYGDSWIRQKGKGCRNICLGCVFIYFLLLGGYAHNRTSAWESNMALKGKLKQLIEQRDLLSREAENP